MTTEALQSLGATLNFIENVLNMLDNNVDARRVDNSTAMKDIFKKISTTMTEPLCLSEKLQNL